MAKIAVILVLVGLTVMTNAYSLRRRHFDQELYTENENEKAQLIKQLEGRDIWSYTHIIISVVTLALSADLQMQDDVGDVQAVSTFTIARNYLFLPKNSVKKNTHTNGKPYVYKFCLKDR